MEATLKEYTDNLEKSNKQIDYLKQENNELSNKVDNLQVFVYCVLLLNRNMLIELLILR